MVPIRPEFGRRSHHWSHHEFSTFFSRGAIGSRRCRRRCTDPGIPTGQRIGWAPVGAYDRTVMRARCIDFVAEQYFVVRFHGQPTNRNYNG